MKIFLPLLIALFGVQAHAGFMIEPFLGIDSGALKTTTLAGQDSSSSSQGFAYGARFGYRFANPVWITAEYMGASDKDDSNSKTELSRTSLSAVFGYDFGKFNLWAGYGFSDKMKVKMTPEIDVSGSNLRFGGGYKAENHVSINLDLIISNYTKASLNGSAEVELDQIYSKFAYTTVMLSVSAPFGNGK